MLYGEWASVTVKGTLVRAPSGRGGATSIRGGELSMSNAVLSRSPTSASPGEFAIASEAAILIT